jgi:Phosphotransferase enzyme family
MGSSALLEGIDSRLGGGPRSWDDVIIVRNVGPIQTRAPLPGDNISNRGFNAILLTPERGTTHFLKVRPATHDRFEREAALTVALAARSTTAVLMARSRAFREGSASVLAQEFVPGTALDVLIRAGRGDPWHVLAREVIEAAQPLWPALCAESGMQTQCRVDSATLTADIALLRTLGLDATTEQKLAALISGRALPVSPQHGDFWPRNVLRVDGGWRILDFENAGDVVLPLYDVFHMIRGCGEAARRGQGDWLELWSKAGRSARPLGESLRRSAGNLDARGVEAAMVAYMVDFTARLHRRGNALERTAVRLRELAALPRWLEVGSLQRLLD